MAVVSGCAHVDGAYSVNHSQGHFLLDGIYAITDIIGLDTVKLFLSADYATHYAGTWPGGITSLKTLAQAAPMSTALALAGVNTFFLNCFTFNDGSSDLWKFGFADQPTYLASEYSEMYDLAEYLLTTYSGTGKTFVLQTWEGDWSLMNGLDATGASQPANDESNYISPRTVQHMRAWLATKLNAIEDARRATSHSNVRVLSAVELNRIRGVFYDRTLRRVVNAVLPHVRPDMVSYSAYDTILGPSYSYYSTQAELITNTATDLGLAIDLIRNAAPHSEVYLGEYGFAELELPVGYDGGDLTDNILTICDNKSIGYALYWEVWDNASPVRGFYLEDSSGTVSEAGTYLQSL